MSEASDNASGFLGGGDDCGVTQRQARPPVRPSARFSVVASYGPWFAGPASARPGAPWALAGPFQNYRNVNLI
jgi:hypothetical protein